MTTQNTARKKPVVEELHTPELSSQDTQDEAVIRALDMYLRQQAFTNHVPLPRWITW